MAPDILIILLVLAFYALECVVWGRRSDTWFRTVGGKTWRIARPMASFEIAQASPLFLFPVPPLGILAPAHLPDLAFSPEGVSPYVAESENAPSDGGAAHYRYEEIERLKVQGQELLINGRPFARMRSKAEAAEAAEFIEKLKAGRIKDREGLIHDRIAGLFKEAAVQKAVEGFIARTDWLSMLANLLWTFLIAGIPAALYVYGFSRIVLYVLAAVLLLHLAVVALTLRAHRKIYGGRDLTLLWRLLPSPFNSIRAADILAKRLLTAYHPFAVGAALLPRERFRPYARKNLARIRHPLYDPGMADAARDTDRWFKARLLLAMEKLAKKSGLDVEALGRPEIQEGTSAQASYCPRCLCAYEQAEGVCGDCGGMKLVPLGDRQSQAKVKDK